MNRTLLVLGLWLLLVGACAFFSVSSALREPAPDLYARTWAFQLIAFAFTWLPWLGAGVGLALLLVRKGQTQSNRG